MSFTDAIKICFAKYADFNGRALRPEFWWFFLFTLLACIVAGVISETLSLLFSLAVLIPSFAVGARRLHDTGRSGWWQLLYLVPLVGLIIVLIFMAQESKPGGEY
jgi:uncharacterized membrane protein YhaH (DUF805 family)